MIIDSRVRPPLPAYRDSYAFTIWQEPTQPYHHMWECRQPTPAAVSGDMNAFVCEMTSAGIDLGVLIARTTKPSPQGREKEMDVSAEDLTALMKSFPNTFVGMSAVDPLDPAAQERVEEAALLGMVGICVEPTRSAECLRINDPRVFSLYRAIERAGLIMTTTLGFNTGKNTAWNDPSAIEAISDLCPHMPILITHACWPLVEELAAIAMRHPNLYLIPDCYFYFPFISTAQEQIILYNNLLQDQVLFGSSYPIRGFLQSVEESLALPWEPEAKEKFLWKNAAKLLRLPPLPCEMVQTGSVLSN